MNGNFFASSVKNTGRRMEKQPLTERVGWLPSNIYPPFESLKKGKILLMLPPKYDPLNETSIQLNMLSIATSVSIKKTTEVRVDSNEGAQICIDLPHL